MFEDFIPGKIMTAPRGKGFVIYRGDAGTIKKGLLRGPFGYKVGSLIPFRGMPVSWSVSKKVAIEFAYGITEHYNQGRGDGQYVPILMKAIIHKLEVSPNFWEMEWEVFPIKSKSKIVSIEAV